jgi:hypothetical protein
MGGPGTVGDIDANLVNDYRVFPVGPYITGTLHAVATTTAWSTAVLTVERSNDGTNWAAMSPSAVTLTAASPMSNTLDVSGVTFIRVRTTTAEGSTSRLRVVGCFKGD